VDANVWPDDFEKKVAMLPCADADFESFGFFCGGRASDEGRVSSGGWALSWWLAVVNPKVIFEVEKELILLMVVAPLYPAGTEELER
jgi:hypothetical protein